MLLKYYIGNEDVSLLKSGKFREFGRGELN